LTESGRLTRCKAAVIAPPGDRFMDEPWVRWDRRTLVVTATIAAGVVGVVGAAEKLEVIAFKHGFATAQLASGTASTGTTVSTASVVSHPAVFSFPVLVAVPPLPGVPTKPDAMSSIYDSWRGVYSAPGSKPTADPGMFKLADVTKKT